MIRKRRPEALALGTLLVFGVGFVFGAFTAPTDQDAAEARRSAAARAAAEAEKDSYRRHYWSGHRDGRKRTEEEAASASETTNEISDPEE